MSTKLESWQEIADYLGVTVRTAQRWERERGLPVTRLPGNRGRVFADTRALERWRKSTQQGPPWWSNLTFFRYYSAATTALLLLGFGVLLGIYLAQTRKGPPANYRVEYRSLVVMDGASRELWRHTFETPLREEFYSLPHSRKRIWFGNLDGNQGMETLFIHDPVTHETTGAALVCFDEHGSVLWTFTPGKEVSDQRRTFAPIFVAYDFLVEDLNGDRLPEILLTSHQLDSHPSQFVILDTDGRIKGEYWHSGQLPWLATGDLDGNGSPEIILGGVNNGYRAAAVVILDPTNVAGASTQAPGDPFQLAGFAKGTERALLLFPRSCANRMLDEYNVVTFLGLVGNVLTVKVGERRSDLNCMVIYSISSDLQVRDLRWADSLKDLHREMEVSGELDHTLTAAEIDSMRHLTVIRR